MIFGPTLMGCRGKSSSRSTSLPERSTTSIETKRARFEHVLFACEDENVFLVLVLDLDAGAVEGHRVLNLNDEYGLASRSHDPDNS